MTTREKTYHSLREEIESYPVIDCHEHTMGPQNAPDYKEPISVLILGYFSHDIMSAGGEGVMKTLEDQDVPTEEKWKTFEPIWRRTEFTGYAMCAKRMLRDQYGIEEVTLESLRKMRENFLDLKDPSVYWGILDQAHVRCRLVNIGLDAEAFIKGERELPERDRLLIGLPGFHGVRTYDQIQGNVAAVGNVITSLDEYLEACRELFARMKERGAVAFKDQSAYGRIIKYDTTTRQEAESLFNLIIEDPRRSLGWPEAKPLGDFLFHSFMRMARDLELPVQLHTGHMAGIRNEISKTNVVHLTNVFELHREVRFDIFHGNWPYAGELLYAGKNYPNVAIDCCWLHIIDPRYSERFLADAVVTVPHAKIHGFGGDFGDTPELAVAHLSMAKDNIAAALAGLADREWLSIEQAREIAADWLFNNPNEFFRLGFEPFAP